MVKSGKPPRWQKGSHEYELTLPAHVTKSGKDEKVRLGFRWEVRATKPMTGRDWTKWEMQCARGGLERATRDLSRGQGVINDLESAFTHAVTAWCRTHLRGKGSSDMDNHHAFLEKAPDLHRQRAAAARAALHGLARRCDHDRPNRGRGVSGCGGAPAQKSPPVPGPQPVGPAAS